MMSLDINWLKAILFKEIIMFIVQVIKDLENLKNKKSFIPKEYLV